ncbi:MAG: hypothetical protein LRY42_00740 [Candidatus Pacebacteria bacterium]|nr:hypothetical protein [Candidatus Paceibacterota bacterium]
MFCPSCAARRAPLKGDRVLLYHADEKQHYIHSIKKDHRYFGFTPHLITDIVKEHFVNGCIISFSAVCCIENCGVIFTKTEKDPFQYHWHKIHQKQCYMNPYRFISFASIKFYDLYVYI